MGGMAAGAAWIASAGQRWRNLIRGYALIEVAIGICGLLFHSIYGGIVGFSYDWLIPTLAAPWAINIVRWVIATLLILPQTILLGMTFPLMSGGLIRRFPGSDGHVLGGLYFTNSIGAACGALVAVFILLPSVGLPGAMGIASVLNFVVAGLAWWLAHEPEPERPAIEAARPAAEQSLRRNPVLRVVLLSTALSGAASFAYEIIWIRMLSMAVGSTMHAFELMLAAFIAGIALGGLWIRKHADRTNTPLRLVGWMQILMGIAALASLAVYATAFAWVGWLMDAIAKTDGGYALFNMGTAAIAISIMLPAAFFAGTTLPLFTVALLRDGLGERTIGRVYAWNTLGSIIGVFFAIHLLIPSIGLKLSLCVAAIVDMAIGLILLRATSDTKQSFQRFGLGAGLAAIALIVAIRIPFDPMTTASGVFRHGRTSLQKGDELLFYRDGKTASVAAVLSTNGQVQISTNGKTDAAIQMDDDQPASLDEPTMVFLASLPLAMHKSPQRAGIIGFGSGLTTHTLLGDPRVQQVDTIEIEPAMVQGAKVFGSRVERAYNDPRSKIIIDDAKSHFSGQNSKYDLIISEPSNPWISGVGALFSKEFYQFVPRHLREDGLFVQWVQLYEIDDALLSSILKALTPAFQDYSAWLSNRSDLLIVASPQGALPEIDPGLLLENAKSQSDLKRMGITHMEQLNFRKIADARILRALSQLHPTQAVNSDFHPTLGLEAPKARFKAVSADTTLTLPVLNRPLLEAMKVSSALSANVTLPTLQHFTADDLTARARRLAQEVRGQSTLHTPTIVSLLSTSRICASALAPQQLRQFSADISDLADRTIKYLPANTLEGVWINPTWLQCQSNLPPDILRALAMLAAHAQRDYSKMEKLGNDWIQDRPTQSYMRNHFDGYAWSGIILAMAHHERWSELPSTLGMMEKSSSISPEYTFIRNIARALSLETKPQ